MKFSLKLGVRLVLAVAAGWLAFRLVPKPLPELSRVEFLTEVRAGHVAKVVVEDLEVITGESTTRGAFRTPFKRPDAALIAELHELGVEVVFEESDLGLI